MDASRRSVPSPNRGGAIAALRAHPDVQVVRLLPGQVVLYPGHYPPGLWLVLEGSLRPLRAGAEAPAEPRPAAFVFPAPAALDLPADVGAVVERGGQALFVPHSVAADADVRRLLLDAALPAMLAGRTQEGR